MTQSTDTDRNISNSSFRNVLHLLGTIIFGYFLLRLVLFILDATGIGLEWLQANQNAGFMIIIFILFFSLLAVDGAISMVRRHYKDEKYGIAEVWISNIRGKTEERTALPPGPEPHLAKSDVSSPSDLTGTQSEDIKYKDVFPINLRYDTKVTKSFDSPHCIRAIDFMSKTTKDDGEIRIELLNPSSGLVTQIEDKHEVLYEIVNIWINVPEENMEERSIRFNVDREWIARSNILTVQLQQFIKGAWNVIPTKAIGQDTDNLLFEAFVPALSTPFAVVGTSM